MLTIQLTLSDPCPAPAHFPWPTSSSFFSKRRISLSYRLLWSPLFLESPGLHIDDNRNAEWSLIAKRAQHSLLLQENPVLAGVAQSFIVWFTSYVLRSLTQDLTCLTTLTQYMLVVVLPSTFSILLYSLFSQLCLL